MSTAKKSSNPARPKHRGDSWADVAQGAEPNHYYSNGQRISIRRDDDQVAVLLSHPSASGMRVRLEQHGLELRSGVFLVPASVLSDSERARLESDGALFPVFEAEGGRLILMPEVRVQGRDHAQVREIRTHLTDEDLADDIEESGNLVQFRPRSGKAIDALRLANAIQERIGPDMSQARFLRVVPRS